MTGNLYHFNPSAPSLRDHIGGTAVAGERDDKIGLALGQHLRVTNRPCSLPVLVPVGLEPDFFQAARDSERPRHHVRATLRPVDDGCRLSIDVREAPAPPQEVIKFGIEGVLVAEVATATDKNSHADNLP